MSTTSRTPLGDTALGSAPLGGDLTLTASYVVPVEEVVVHVPDGVLTLLVADGALGVRVSDGVLLIVEG